jgi:hypothetical protein
VCTTGIFYAYYVDWLLVMLECWKHIGAINRNKLKANIAYCWFYCTDILRCMVNTTLNSVLLVFYMFLTSYVHHQEDCTVHEALYGMFSLHLRKQCSRLEDVLVQYSLPVEEHKCWKQVEDKTN